MQKQTRWQKPVIPWLAGILGAALIVFMSWRQNIAMAAFLIPLLLVFSFRRLPKFLYTLPLAVLCVAAKVAALHGGWDIDLGMEIGFGLLTSLPLLIALYLDRALHTRLKPLPASLLFPAAYTALDYLLSLSPVGMTFSLAYTQSRSLLLAQSAALAGSFFTGFIVAWLAPTLSAVLDRAPDGKRHLLPIAAYGLVLVTLLGYGSVKQLVTRPEGDTVRIASISQTLPEDPWSITDAGTPRDGADEKKAVFETVNSELFRLSGKAADFGAKIIFWSEGNYPIYEDQYDQFLQTARAFARDKGVYLMATPLVLHYDSNKNDNLAILFDPSGNQLFRYEKTYSWYPTDSDGIIPKADTPYGKIGTAICFDMDFPAFLRQAADADILLIPAYDTKKISPYHTHAALMRGVEYGFSVVRQCNAGESTAADYNGEILASQNYFTAGEHVMISDVPTRGINTLYEATGDWFLYLNAAGLLLLIVLSVLSGHKKREQ